MKLIKEINAYLRTKERRTRFLVVFFAADFFFVTRFALAFFVATFFDALTFTTFIGSVDTPVFTAELDGTCGTSAAIATDGATSPAIKALQIAICFIDFFI